MMLGQDEVCVILRKHLGRYGVSEEFEHELTGLHEDEDGESRANLRSSTDSGTLSPGAKAEQDITVSTRSL